MEGYEALVNTLTLDNQTFQGSISFQREMYLKEQLFLTETSLFKSF